MIDGRLPAEKRSVKWVGVLQRNALKFKTVIRRFKPFQTVFPTVGIIALGYSVDKNTNLFVPFKRSDSTLL
jgi:hypothetical protein